MFPSYRYHQVEEPRIISSAAEEAPGWLDSPAGHGIETNPGAQPDLSITELIRECDAPATAQPASAAPKRSHAKKAKDT